MYKKGHPQFNTGRTHFKKGIIPWHKGKIGVYSKEVKKKMGEKNIGKVPWNKNLTKEIDVRVKKYAMNSGITRKIKGSQKGNNHWNWKGGIAPVNNIIRGSLEYKLWSDSVWNRDGNCCQKCGEDRISKLVAHHILNFSSRIELRFAIDNGITLCINCHRKFHKIYGKKDNNLKQIKEFLNQRNL